MSQNKATCEWREVSTQAQSIEGMLSEVEARCLYQLAKNCGGTIVEIGSWKGKSTVCLALGSKAGFCGKVFAIDPHQGVQDDHVGIHRTERTEPVFRKNITRAHVDDIVVPLVMKSEDAANGWTEPISLLFIDGAHDYKNVKLDLDLWEPHLIQGGTIVFHDALYSLGHNYPGIRKVVISNILRSPEFSNVRFCSSMVYATKSQTSPQDRFFKLQKLLLYHILPPIYFPLAPIYRFLAKTRLLGSIKWIRDKLQL